MNAQEDLLKMCLQKQLDEFHMLSSIFCNPGELHVDDYSFVDNINAYLDGETQQLTAKLDYQLNLPLMPEEQVQILVELPHLYPALEIPRIIIRSSLFSRQQERQLLCKIEEYITTEVMDKDETFVFQIVSWIQDNFSKLVETTSLKHEQNTVSHTNFQQSQGEAQQSHQMERLWIYSHHLKSKPAIICVEGYQPDTQEFWRTIKTLKWQKIQIKLVENLGDEDQTDGFRRFSGFREELFCELDGENNEELPMSMSLFMRFLEKHHSGYIKKELFGFDVKEDDS